MDPFSVVLTGNHGAQSNAYSIQDSPLQGEWSGPVLVSFPRLLKNPDKRQLGDKGFFLLPVPGYSHDGWGSPGRGLKQLVTSHPPRQSE